MKTGATPEPMELTYLPSTEEYDASVAIKYTDGSIKPLKANNPEGDNETVLWDDRLFLSTANCSATIGASSIGRVLEGSVNGVFSLESCSINPDPNQMTTNVILDVDGVRFKSSEPITANYSDSLNLYRIFIRNLSLFERVGPTPAPTPVSLVQVSPSADVYLIGVLYSDDSVKLVSDPELTETFECDSDDTMHFNNVENCSDTELTLSGDYTVPPGYDLVSYHAYIDSCNLSDNIISGSLIMEIDGAIFKCEGWSKRSQDDFEESMENFVLQTS